jgi:hypothetical protein
VRYEHYTRNGREEIFRVKPTGEVLCCGGAANRLNEQAQTIDELAGLLRRIRSACADIEEPCALLPADIIKSLDAALAKVGTP